MSHQARRGGGEAQYWIDTNMVVLGPRAVTALGIGEGEMWRCCTGAGLLSSAPEGGGPEAKRRCTGVGGAPGKRDAGDPVNLELYGHMLHALDSAKYFGTGGGAEAFLRASEDQRNCSIRQPAESQE
mmetsp:Transcript_49966/g.97778  ORF Transcript_49966/g.97778 Transcript_49966/m.97778 type:complete len:127 (+) Transcript_49966:128-508(+)